MSINAHFKHKKAPPMSNRWRSFMTYLYKNADQSYGKQQNAKDTQHYY